MTPRVFLISQSTRFDYSTVEEFGSPVFLLGEREVSPFNVDQVMARVEEELIRHRFDLYRDFIALTGPAAMVALLMGYLGTLRRPIKLLIFHASHGVYQTRVMDGSRVSLAPSRGEG
jgi:hypothetical protein